MSNADAKPQESFDFFTKMLGMQESGRDKQSVFLRGYEDTYHHTLQLTEAREPGLGHIGWRTKSPEALESRVKALSSTPYGVGWKDNSIGHGAAYEFVAPDGHRGELMWDVEYFDCPEALKSLLRNVRRHAPLRAFLSGESIT